MSLENKLPGPKIETCSSKYKANCTEHKTYFFDKHPLALPLLCISYVAGMSLIIYALS